MAYSSLHNCIQDLDKSGQIIRIKSEVDPKLEAAEIHRRFYDAGGPAILFEHIKGSPFPAVSNIYGTIERTEYIFRDTLKALKKVIALKVDPSQFFKSPFKFASAPFTALKALPLRSVLSKPVAHGSCRISDLPQIVSWPMDGGAFVTLPQVFTLPPGSRKMMESNLGMYRIQLSGNEYLQNKEIGLHYQLHRGIGVHHTLYNQSNEDFKVSIFVGGPPSHAFSAIMPMPEGLSELTFAGMLGGRRFRYFRENGHVISSDADFCITGTIKKNTKKPEGPFGDHLGYYSLTHDFPVMEVEKVYHRKNAIWQFTVVGRPPQEDSSFGYLIHQLVSELTPQEFPGLIELNAVDVAGVHPLLLAIGSERYMPFRERKPEEILTIANRILGSGQTSLAKFLFIAATGDDPSLSTHHMPEFFTHILQRVKWERDLHFQTNTTIDTLDYSGSGWNAGSKLVIACCGEPVRELATKLPDDFRVPTPFSKPRLVNPGIIAINAATFSDYPTAQKEMDKLCSVIASQNLEQFPLIIICDNSDFISARFNNFLWAGFTRANPSHDVYGVNSFVKFKHWGCRGPLIIDARIKSHHAPVLERDPKISKKVDKLFAKGGELHGKIS